MLDNANVIKQKDPYDALGVAAKEYEQLGIIPQIAGEFDRSWLPLNIVLLGMGGSALAAGLIKSWKDLPVPFEVVRDYEVPYYVGERTLVIACSYSGNTEETVAALRSAQSKGARTVIIASGGTLKQIATEENIPFVPLIENIQPRMAAFNSLVALSVVFEACGLSGGLIDEIKLSTEFITEAVSNWLPGVPTEQNYAKQLALKAVGKTPVIYGGPKTACVAYKWKISFNENAKNTAFTNAYPEFNHNEFIGWTSHPIEKPFVIFDLVSSFEKPQILKRFELSDRLLSGRRPKANTVALEGDTLLKQLLWGSLLGEFVTIYTAILNGVDPTKVELIEKFKQELA